jgi:predicted phage tail protein
MKNVILPMITKMMPSLIAQQIIGVQPMPLSAGLIFTQKMTTQDPNIVKFHKKYKFSRAKWYIAEFDATFYDEVDEWCAKQFGKHDKRPDAWSRWWHRYESSIHFRDEKDYLMFLLRWGV